MVADADPVGGRRAVEGGDQRWSRAAAPALVGRIPGPGEVADPMAVGEPHQAIDVAVGAIGLPDLVQQDRVRGPRGHDRATTARVARRQSAVDVIVGDQLMKRVIRHVRRPARQLGGVGEPAERQRLGRAGRAHGVDELLHPGRPVCRDPSRRRDLAAVSPAAPADPVGLVEEVEHEVVVAAEGPRHRPPERGSVVGIGHRQLVIGHRVAGRGPVQIEDHVEAGGVERAHVGGDDPAVRGPAQPRLGVQAQPAVLVERDAHRVGAPARDRRDHRRVVDPVGVRADKEPPPLDAGVLGP